MYVLSASWLQKAAADQVDDTAADGERYYES